MPRRSGRGRSAEIHVAVGDQVDQSVAAWAALVYLIADSDVDFRAAPAP